MDLERALVSRAVAFGEVSTLVSRGIEPELIFQPDVREVYAFSVSYFRQYRQAPSGPLLRERFPNWHGESTNDPVDALCDQFLENLNRRYFEATVLELSEMSTRPDYREQWGRLDEVLLDKARQFAALVPSGRVSRFSAEFMAKIESYEVEKGQYRPGTPMGLPVIDQMTQGIRPGWLVTTAGFSGRGKSYLTTHAALTAFEDDKRVLFLSLEMSRNEVIERLHTMVMRWRHHDFLRRALTDGQVQRWRDVARVYTKAAGEIVVVDKLGGCSLDRVHAEIHRYRPDVVALDYVQRMRSSYASKRPKWEQLEEITNELKTIAMDTDSAILMVSQDGRSSADEGSTAANAGGSISVYQAADLYLGMMQDEAMRATNKMRIKALKFRHGPLSEEDIVWDLSTGDIGRPYTDADQFQRPAVMS